MLVRRFVCLLRLQWPIDLIGGFVVVLATVFKGTVLSEANVHLAGIQDVDEHLRRRRAWNRGLAPTALKGYEQVAATRILQLVDTLEKQKGAVVLGDWFNYLAYVMLLSSIYVTST